MLGTFIRFVPVDIVDLRPGGGGDMLEATGRNQNLQ